MPFSQHKTSTAMLTGKVRVLSHAREKTPGSQVAHSIYQHSNSIPFTACAYMLHRLSTNYIFITKGSLDVTHCARYIMANNRPYQLRWGEWKMGDWYLMQDVQSGGWPYPSVLTCPLQTAGQGSLPIMPTLSPDCRAAVLPH